MDKRFCIIIMFILVIESLLSTFDLDSFYEYLINETFDEFRFNHQQKTTTTLK
jgi:hypothetical protein